MFCKRLFNHLLLSSKVCPKVLTNCLSTQTSTAPTVLVAKRRTMTTNGVNHNYETIAIEGNIGSGKTTFLRHLQQMSGEANKQIQCFCEPVDKWRDVRGHNLFQLLSEDVNRWCFAFQSYVQLSMLELHQMSPKAPDVTIKLMERTIYSARYCFVENLFRRRHLRHEDYSILDEWFTHLVTNEPKIGVDLIIYLRTDPEVVFERIRKRGRSEEQNITIDYLKDLHDLHEEWLLSENSKFSIPAPVITIDANLDLDSVKRLYDRHSVDILNGKAFKPVLNVCNQY